MTDTIVREWAIVALETPRQTTLHVLGILDKHYRLDVGEPYISSAVNFSLRERSAINSQGRTTQLIGEPQPDGEPLPLILELMIERASVEWRIPSEAQWRRVTLGA